MQRTKCIRRIFHIDQFFISPSILFHVLWMVYILFEKRATNTIYTVIVIHNLWIVSRFEFPICNLFTLWHLIILEGKKTTTNKSIKINKNNLRKTSNRASFVQIRIQIIVLIILVATQLYFIYIYKLLCHASKLCVVLVICHSRAMHFM